MHTLAFQGPRCRGQVQSLGAMLGPVHFELAPGRSVQPLALAPWADDPAGAAWPGVLRRLRGEWPCVPFGAPSGASARGDLPPDWRAAARPCVLPGEAFHGEGANGLWALQAHAGGGVQAMIDYPAEHPVRRLERHIRPDPREAALHLALTVHARRPSRLPLGLHPVLRLPRDGQGRALPLELSFSEPDLHAWSFPVDVEPGRSVLRPDQRQRPLQALLDRDGRTVNPLRLPFARPGEDLLLITGFRQPQARVRLSNRSEGYALTLSWCAHDLPSCLLWISHFGRLQPPWNGRFCALGVEPVAAPFDLGPAFAADADHPLARAGIPTAVALRPDAPWTTRYSLRCSPLNDDEES